MSVSSFTAKEIEELGTKNEMLRGMLLSNASIASAPPITLNASAMVQSSAGIASKPMQSIVVDGNSNELSDTRYLNKLQDIASTNCYIISWDDINNSNPMLFDNEERSLFGFRLSSIQPYNVIIDNAYFCRQMAREYIASPKNPEFINVLTNLSMPYIIHGLLSDGLAPCIRNNKLPAALVTRSPVMVDYGGKVSMNVMPVNFIESPVGIPKEKNGQFNIRSVREMILSVECN